MALRELDLQGREGDVRDKVCTARQAQLLLFNLAGRKVTLGGNEDKYFSCNFPSLWFRVSRGIMNGFVVPG